MTSDLADPDRVESEPNDQMGDEGPSKVMGGHRSAGAVQPSLQGRCDHALTRTLCRSRGCPLIEENTKCSRVARPSVSCWRHRTHECAEGPIRIAWAMADQSDLRHEIRDDAISRSDLVDCDAQSS
jgi:hypothetical protein